MKGNPKLIETLKPPFDTIQRIARRAAAALQESLERLIRD